MAPTVLPSQGRIRGWRALLVAGLTGYCGSALYGQDLPDFGALDAGGMPACLIELSAQTRTAGWVLDANTRYWVWAAPKVAGRGYLQSAWRASGPYRLGGARRYLYTWDGAKPGGSLADAAETNVATPILSPALASLQLQNLDGENVWLITNPLPPGCAAVEASATEPDRVETGGSIAEREHQALKYAAALLERNRSADQNALPVEYQVFETQGLPSIRVTTGIDSAYLLRTNSPQSVLDAQIKATLAYDDQRLHLRLTSPAGLTLNHIQTPPQGVGMAGSMSTLQWTYPGYVAYVVTTADFGNLGRYYSQPDTRQDTVQKRTERCLQLADALHRGMQEAGLTGTAPAAPAADGPQAALKAAQARLSEARRLYTRLVTTGPYAGDPYHGDVAQALRDYQAAVTAVEQLQAQVDEGGP